MLVTFDICFKQHFDTRYLVFYNPSPPRMFLSLDLIWEYRIQRGAIGPLYATFSYSTWIFCKGVPSFATDCPCDVWCRGLTTGLLHVGPPFGNRFLNTSWAVGLTYWIVYLHFFCILTYAILYVLIHHIMFWLYFYFLNILYFFRYSCTNIFHRRTPCTFYYKSYIFQNEIFPYISLWAFYGKYLTPGRIYFYNSSILMKSITMAFSRLIEVIQLVGWLRRYGNEYIIFHTKLILWQTWCL